MKITSSVLLQLSYIKSNLHTNSFIIQFCQILEQFGKYFFKMKAIYKKKSTFYFSDRIFF